MTRLLLLAVLLVGCQEWKKMGEMGSKSDYDRMQTIISEYHAICPYDKDQYGCIQGTWSMWRTSRMLSNNRHDEIARDAYSRKRFSIAKGCMQEAKNLGIVMSKECTEEAIEAMK